jgi:hypothetical protein
MTTHEEQNYKRKLALASINKGPGTKALLAAKPGDSFTFDGDKLCEGEYSLGIPRSLVEIQPLGGHNFVLWLSENGYPRWVERVAYNGHSRSGLSELWERQLSPNATAQEKADHEDAGSTMLLPVSALWFVAIMFGLLGWVGFHFGSPSNPLAGMLMLFWLGAPSFAAMAIWKQDRDRFNRALDVINALDLRRT